MRISPQIEARLAALERSVEPPDEPIDEDSARRSWELLQDTLEGLQEQREPMPADWLTQRRRRLSQEQREKIDELRAQLQSSLVDDL